MLLILLRARIGKAGVGIRDHIDDLEYMQEKEQLPCGTRRGQPLPCLTQGHSGISRLTNFCLCDGSWFLQCPLKAVNMSYVGSDNFTPGM